MQESSDNEHEMSCLPFHKPRWGTEIQSEPGFRVLIEPFCSNPTILMGSILQAKIFICSGSPIMAIDTMKQKVSQRKAQSIQEFSSFPWPQSNDATSAKVTAPVPTCSSWIGGNSIRCLIQTLWCFVSYLAKSCLQGLSWLQQLPYKVNSPLRHWVISSNTCFLVFTCSCGRQYSEVVKDKVHWASDCPPIVNLHLG